MFPLWWGQDGACFTILANWKSHKANKLLTGCTLVVCCIVINFGLKLSPDMTVLYGEVKCALKPSNMIVTRIHFLPWRAFLHSDSDQSVKLKKKKFLQNCVQCVSFLFGTLAERRCTSGCFLWKFHFDVVASCLFFLHRCGNICTQHWIWLLTLSNKLASCSLALKGNKTGWALVTLPWMGWVFVTGLLVCGSSFWVWMQLLKWSLPSENPHLLAWK